MTLAYGRAMIDRDPRDIGAGTKAGTWRSDCQQQTGAIVDNPRR
jgi:hypothetical protein